MNTTQSMTPDLPRWATSAQPWEDAGGEYRIVSRDTEAVGHEVALDAMQLPDGRTADYSLSLGDLDGRILDDPPADLRRIAATILDLADALERRSDG